MFTTAIFSLLAISAVAPSVSAMPSHGAVRNVHRSVPSQFQQREYAEDADLLEPYQTYADRYLQFDCEDQHNSTFWDSCCHPLLKDESVDSLPDVCGCDVEETSSSAAPHTSTVAAITSSVVEKPATTTTHPAESTSKVHTTSVEPTTTEKPETTHTTSEAPKTTTTKASSNDNVDWRTGGKGTFFYQEGNAGACGKKNPDSAHIVAIDIHYYGNTGEVSSYCGKTVYIVNTDNGKTATATVADVCPTCDTNNSLDMSVGLFNELSTESIGEFNLKYYMMEN